jgi:hypothetical protein
MARDFGVPHAAWTMPSSSAFPDSDSAQAAPSPGAEGANGAGPLGGMGGSFYALLQVSPTASPQQLRQSFRRLSKCYHPDTTTLPGAEAAQAFQRLRQAYAVLGDPQARRLYDERLRLQPWAAGPATTTANGSSSPPARGPASIRRSLSGGEWFALLLLAIALVLSLVLGLGVAWARGAELMRWPSWWTDLHPAALTPPGSEPTPGADSTPGPAPGVDAAPGSGPAPGNGMVEGPQSPPLTADAPHVPAL